jgi:hypothetical protein
MAPALRAGGGSWICSELVLISASDEECIDMRMQNEVEGDEETNQKKDNCQAIAVAGGERSFYARWNSGMRTTPDLR